MQYNSIIALSKTGLQILGKKPLRFMSLLILEIKRWLITAITLTVKHAHVVIVKVLMYTVNKRRKLLPNCYYVMA